MQLRRVLTPCILQQVSDDATVVIVEEGALGFRLPDGSHCQVYAVDKTI